MYEPSELKQIMKEQQEKYGCFKDTLDEKYKTKRLVRLSKFTEVTHGVIETLKLWGIPFTLCEVLHSKKQRHRITTDIFIPNANIAIRQYDVNDEVEVSKQKCYYEAFKKSYYVMFIRSNETKERVLEKLMNVIKKANDEPQKGFASYKFIEPVKKKKEKRPRVKAVKVEPRKSSFRDRLIEVENKTDKLIK